MPEFLAVGHFGGKPPVPIDVLAFGDEEGSRFPSTLSSSAACAGAFEHDTLKLADSAGVSFADALKGYGKDFADIPKAAYAPGEAAAYVEVHIEQGPLLEAENQPLGVVTGIVGQSRWRVTVTGEAGHAGTVPMNLRRDALAGSAEMALAAERIAKAAQQMVATVGRIEAMPGASNIIPGQVTFTVDLRCMDDAERKAAVAQFEADARRIAAAAHTRCGVRAFSRRSSGRLRRALAGYACRGNRRRPAAYRFGFRRVPATMPR